MLRQVEELLDERARLVAWWQQYQALKLHDASAKLGVLVDFPAVNVFIRSAGQCNAVDSILVRSCLARIIESHAETFVQQAYEEALAKINSELAKRKAAVQEMLESI